MPFLSRRLMLALEIDNMVLLIMILEREEWKGREEWKRILSACLGRAGQHNQQVKVRHHSLTAAFIDAATAVTYNFMWSCWHALLVWLQILRTFLSPPTVRLNFPSFSPF